MKVLFDTNVVLDFLLAREPWADIATELFVQAEKGRIEGLVGATTVTTIHYLAHKSFGRARAAGAVADLLRLFRVAPVDFEVLTSALAMEMEDFEDAVLVEAARRTRASCLVTRNARDFKKADGISITSPGELALRLRNFPPSARGAGRQVPSEDLP